MVDIVDGGEVGMGGVERMAGRIEGVMVVVEGGTGTGIGVEIVEGVGRHQGLLISKPE
jgi:hypothetical protein